MKKNTSLFRLLLAAMFLALAIVLPFLTGQIQQIGNMLCPMHLPVLLCGFFCGPWYAVTVGLTAPMLRFFLFGMPPIFPNGLAMCFELAAYGLISGLLWHSLPKKKWAVFAALLPAMLIGRAVWGAVRVILSGLGKAPFGWELFLTGAFTNAIPGIILQLILVPVLVLALQKVICRLNP